MQEDGVEAMVTVLERDIEGVGSAGQHLVTVNPRVIWGQMKRTEWANFCSIEELKTQLATRLGGDVICPDTFGASIRITCEASYEDLCRGGSLEDVAPFWRVIEPGSVIAQELSCGSDWILAKREKELAAELLPKSIWGRYQRILGFEWPTDEEIGNNPIETILDIKVHLELSNHLIFFEDFMEDQRQIHTCLPIYEGQPWWGVIRDMSSAADYPVELAFPLYDEFEGTELSGLEFAEIIGKRIGKPFERLGPYSEPIEFEVWDFRETKA